MIQVVEVRAIADWSILNSIRIFFIENKLWKLVYDLDIISES